MKKHFSKHVINFLGEFLYIGMVKKPSEIVKYALFVKPHIN